MATSCANRHGSTGNLFMIPIVTMPLKLLLNRKSDILKIDPHALDKFSDIIDSDLFYSRDSDENLADLIIKPCKVGFVYAEKRTPKKCSAMDFVCSYRFNPQTAVISKLKVTDAEKYQQRQLIAAPIDDFFARSHAPGSEDIIPATTKATANSKAPFTESRTEETKAVKQKSTNEHVPLESLPDKASKKRKIEAATGISHNLLMGATTVDPTAKKVKASDVTKKSVTSRVSADKALLAEPILQTKRMKAMKHAMDGENAVFDSTVSSLDASKVSRASKKSRNSSRGSEADSPISTEEVDPAFIHMCDAMRPQILNRLGDSVSDADVANILMQLWEEMSPEERETYRTTDTPHVPIDSNDILLHDEMDFDVESENSSEIEDREGERYQEGEQTESHSAVDLKKRLRGNEVEGESHAPRRSSRARVKTEIPEKIFLTRSANVGHSFRVGHQYQAEIPMLGEVISPSPADCYELVSSPETFANDNQNEFITLAKTAAVAALTKCMGSRFRIDGTLALLSNPIELVAMEALQAR